MARDSRVAYDAIEALNWSTLKLIETSPALLKYRLTNPRPDTPSLRLGRAIHCAVLEPERWSSGAYVVEPDADKRTREGKAERAKWLVDLVGGDAIARPDFGDLRKKENKAARDAWEEDLPEGAVVFDGTEKVDPLLPDHVEVISAEERALAERLAKAAREHPKAAEYLSLARTEETITWTDPETGVPCKARLDVGKPMFVLDLKSSRRTNLRTIGVDFARYLYHGQLAFYHDGAIASRLIPADAPTPRVLVLQTVEPFDVVPGWIGEWDLNQGRALYRSLLTRYLECQAADWWPGLAPEPVEIPIPEWAPGALSDVDEEDW